MPSLCPLPAQSRAVPWLCWDGCPISALSLVPAQRLCWDGCPINALSSLPTPTRAVPWLWALLEWVSHPELFPWFLSLPKGTVQALLGWVSHWCPVPAQRQCPSSVGWVSHQGTPRAVSRQPQGAHTLFAPQPPQLWVLRPDPQVQSAPQGTACTCLGCGLWWELSSQPWYQDTCGWLCPTMLTFGIQIREKRVMLTEHSNSHTLSPLMGELQHTG